MNNKFVVIRNNRTKQFIVLETDIADILTYIYSNRSKWKYKLIFFDNSFQERIKRLIYIEYLKAKDFYPNARCLIDFIKGT